MEMKNFYKKIDEFGKVIVLYAHPNPVMNTSDLIEITQEEYKTLNAEIKQHTVDVRTYTEQVMAGTLQLSDVPEDCRGEVEEIINQPESEPYGVMQSEEYQTGYDQAVLDMMELMRNNE